MIKNKNRPAVLITVLFILCSASVFGGSENIPSFTTYSKVVFPSEQTQISTCDVLAVPITSDVYKNTKSNFSNMRLFNGAGREIQYMVVQSRKAVTVMRKVRYSTTIADIKKLPDNKIEIVFSPNSKMPRIDEITIYASNRNFEKEVDIYGREKNSDWKLLKKGAAIFDYSSIIDLRSTTIKEKLPYFSSYKFVIHNFVEEKESAVRELTREIRKKEEYSTIIKYFEKKELLKIDNIVMYCKKDVPVADSAVIQPYPVSFNVDNSDPEDTKVTIETGREPLTKISISTSSVNFKRRAVLSGSTDKKTWKELKRTALSRIKLGPISEEYLDINFAQSQYPYYLIAIANKDAEPIKIEDISAQGNTYNIVFIKNDSSKKDIALYFGGKHMSAPEYDIASVIPDLNKLEIAYLSLAPSGPNPEYSQESEKQKEIRWFESKILFYSAIVLMVLILIWALYIGIKKIDNT